MRTRRQPARELIKNNQDAVYDGLSTELIREVILEDKRCRAIFFGHLDEKHHWIHHIASDPEFTNVYKPDSNGSENKADLVFTFDNRKIRLQNKSISAPGMKQISPVLFEGSVRTRGGGNFDRTAEVGYEYKTTRLYLPEVDVVVASAAYLSLDVTDFWYLSKYDLKLVTSRTFPTHVRHLFAEDNQPFRYQVGVGALGGLWKNNLKAMLRSDLRLGIPIES